jgi:AAA domain/DnaB-like helicase N terminal domain
MMASPAAVDDVTGVLGEMDFYRPAHQMIFAAVVALRATPGVEAEPLTVLAELTKRGELTRCGGAVYLHTCYAAATFPASAGYYARLVKDASLRRRLEESGIRLAHMATELEDADPAELIARIRQELDGLDPRGGATAETITAFATRDLSAGEPVIPGLLNAQDRVITVAPEGIGKSVLATQVWVTTACGRHAFTSLPQPPRRVLLADLENGPPLVQRRVRRLLRLAEGEPGWNPDRARIICRPGGLDLRAPADQAYMTALIAEAKPDLVVAGPLYKMTVDRGERAEQLHWALASYWDQVRERFGCALWLEAHAPLAQAGTRDLRPIGSGVWTRWPEYGVSLSPSHDKTDPPGTLKLGRFRQDRDDSVWPVKLTRGRAWPWEAVYPTGTFT